MHARYESMLANVKVVETAVKHTQEGFQNGEYQSCDDEIWRVGVYLVSTRQHDEGVARMTTS